MLFFVFTSISFILFMKSLSPQPLLPPWASDMRILPIKFWKDLSFSLKNSIFSSFLLRIRSTLSMEPRNFDGSASKSEYGVEENQQGGQQISVLDLPELTLECILEKLPPAELVSVRGVCSSLRERCTSDHLWEKHMNQKWGRLIGPAAHRQWQWFLSIRENSGSGFSDGCGFKNQGLSKFLVRSLWGFSWFGLKPEKGNKKSYEKRDRKHCPVDSVMSWYLALETGKLWFPAQVYNRENGHVGFMLSCYDAELSYDAQTDTFQARYPPHGRRSVAIENGVQWERLRAPPVGTSPHDLHFSDCLNDLRPGDNIEIQWRRNKEFPYGWWYGVVGHLELCDGNESFCRCHNSDTVVLEFNQYAPGSRWRRTTINRKDHREEGNEGDGFYGGIRKLYNKDDISTWKRLWPTEALE